MLPSISRMSLSGQQSKVCPKNPLTPMGFSPQRIPA